MPIFISVFHHDGLGPRFPIGLFTLSDLQFELEQKLHKKVDLVSENGLNKFIKERVLKEVKYFYEE